MFENFSDYMGERSLEYVLETIKNGSYAEVIKRLRRCIDEGRKEAADAIKKQLPAFVFSARYRGQRLEEFVAGYNGAIMLDFDSVGEDSVERYMRHIASIPYTLFCFRSPSGNGIKVGVLPKTDILLTATNHKLIYNLVACYYESQLGLKVDRSGSDMGRLCFVSYDPELYYNPELKVETLDIMDDCVRKSAPAKAKNAGKAKNTDSFAIFSKAQKVIADYVGEYEEGNRNNFIYYLSVRCLENGIPSDELSTLLQLRFGDLSRTEILQIVKSAVKRLGDSEINSEKKGLNSVKKNVPFF